MVETPSIIKNMKKNFLRNNQYSSSTNFYINNKLLYSGDFVPLYKNSIPQQINHIYNKISKLIPFL